MRGSAVGGKNQRPKVDSSSAADGSTSAEEQSPSSFLQSLVSTASTAVATATGKNKQVNGGSSSSNLLGELVTDFDEMHMKENALIRWWKPFLGFAWCFFIFYQISIGLDRRYNENPLCPYSDREFPKWYFYICYAVLGGFILILSVLCMKLFQMRSGNKRIPIFVAFNIVVMGTIVTVLSVIFEVGGTCIDVLNVASPASIWGEWMACGPLLYFLTFTVADKPNLTKADLFFMLMFFLCLLTGFFVIPDQPYASGAFWLAVSFATYMPVLIVPWYEGDDYHYHMPVSDHDMTREEKERHLKMHAERFAMRHNLAMCLEIVNPLYAVNYVITVFGGIDAPTTIAIYQVLVLCTKGLFAAFTMDIHLDLLIKVEAALIKEKRANEARRSFMKYIFHEVRTPLNSLTMGIDLLTMSENLDSIDRESLAMMKAASEFMSDTLDDVLSMQKIEEGKLELEMGPFSFENTIKRVFATFHGAVTKKKISLSYSIAPQTPYRLIGDIHRIEHVISNLLSNAIKFTPEGKHITINVLTDSIKSAAAIVSAGSTKSQSFYYKGTGQRSQGAAADQHHEYTKQDPHQQGDGDIATITVSIQDQGAGISKENQALLFNNFVQIRPGALQNGQGSGLGLSFCKQIVQLHGGTIGITSEGEGRGSKFFFTIPYAVARTLPTDGGDGGGGDGGSSSRAGDEYDIEEGSSSAASSEPEVEEGTRGGEGETKNHQQQVAATSTTATVSFVNKSAGSSSGKGGGGGGGGMSGNNYTVTGVGAAAATATDSFFANPVIFEQEQQQDGHQMASERSPPPQQGGARKGGGTTTAVGLIEGGERGGGGGERGERGVAGEGEGLLPPSVSQQQLQENVATTTAATAASEVPSGSFEVLVVDDADSNRKMLTMLLKRKGMVSETAENGLIAVNIVKEDLNRFKLVLMDNLMPVMNGVDAAKEMRLAGYSNLLAGITGNVMEDDIDEFLTAGADIVISKPLKKSTLDMLVKHISETGAVSKTGYRLIEQVDVMEWIPK